MVGSLHLEQQLGALPLDNLTPARGVIDVQQVEDDQGGEELQLSVLRSGEAAVGSE